MTVPSDPRTRFLLTRRAFLGVSVGTLATIALASCAPAANWVQPDGAPVREAERRRGGTGKVTTATLTAAPSALDLAGTTAATLAFGASRNKSAQ